MHHSLYQEAYQLIEDSGLVRVTEPLKNYLKPGIRMESYPAPHRLPLGGSKLGGTPDLPLSLIWPMWKEVPMIFLAQIQLEDIAPYDKEQLLPSHGLLYFFCQSQDFSRGFDTNGWDYIDPGEPESWEVLFFEGNASDLHITYLPKGLAPEALLPTCTLHFWPVLMLPPLESTLIGLIHLQRGEIKRYLDLLTRFEEVYNKENAFHCHRLLGYPMQMQDDMQLHCHLSSIHMTYEQWALLDEEVKKSIRADALEWIHLLQIDTDEHAQVTWGDAGSLSYWVKQTDLRARNFNGCWAIEDSL